MRLFRRTKTLTISEYLMFPFMMVYSIIVYGERRRLVVSTTMTVGCCFSSVTRERVGRLLLFVFSPRAALVGARIIKDTAVFRVSHGTPLREVEG